MRNEVVSQLVRKFLYRHFLSVQHLTVLVLQLFHRLRTCAGCRLISRDMHTADMTQTLDSLQGHYHLNRRTVRIGNDIPRTNQCIGGIHLRHH